MIKLTMILLSLIAVGHIETVLGQSLTPDSTGIYYTEDQDIKCLQCLVNVKKDSAIIEKQAEVIRELAGQNELYELQDSLKQERMEGLEKDNGNLKGDLVKARKSGRIKAFTFGGLGSIIGFVISLL
jgi:hypothetical protein